MNDRVLFINAQIITPDTVHPQGSVLVNNGRIVDVSADPLYLPGTQVIDCQGMYLMPGLVDTHSDALELEIQPRPRSIFPIEWSFRELERKLAAQGITTIHHALSMMGVVNEKKVMRQNDRVYQNICAIKSMVQDARLIRNYVHLRLEITNLEAGEMVEQLIREEKLDQLSFMDHTPGQGQYRNIEAQRNFYLIRGDMSEKETDEFLAYLRTLPKLDAGRLQALGELAWDHGIPVASHDDDSIAKLDLMQEWKASICEFPVDLDVAVDAKRRGMYTVMGAPNVLLGKSHSNNLSALDAIKHDAVDILCSDYYPPSMLQAAFEVADKGYKTLPEAVRMVTLNPAVAIGLGHELGSVEPGKTADLLLVKMAGGRPIVDRTFVNGKLAMQMNYELNQSALVSVKS